MKNSYIIAIAIIVAAFIIAGAVITVNRDKSPSEAGQNEADTGSSGLTVREQDHVRGNSDAPVTIVEYSDFQCPFCQRFHPTVKRILDDYPNQVNWVYRHFPLGFHENAQPAAEASECAAEQGKFWEFADGLFENQSKLGNAFYKELAQDLGLNAEQFDNCVSSRKYKDIVEADYQEGIKDGVTGTPGSFVNGEQVSGAVPYETLKAIVERALDN